MEPNPTTEEVIIESSGDSVIVTEETPTPTITETAAVTEISTTAIPVETPAADVIELFPHQALIAKNNIDTKQLPPEIKNQNSSWILAFGRYKKNKLEKDYASLQKLSLLICHDIQNWLEKDLPSSDSDQVVVAPIVAVPVVEEKVVAVPVVEEKVVAVPVVEEKVVAVPVVEEKVDEEIEFTPPRHFRRERLQRKPIPIELTPEQMVLNALDASGKIHFDELTKINGGKSPSFSLTLGKTTLENEYMTNYYRVKN